MAMTTIRAQALFMHVPFAGRAVRTLFLLGLAVLLVACQQEEHIVGRKHINQESSLTPRLETQPSADEDGNWVMPAKDYASTRFSGLDQINRDSVKQLGVTATFSTGFVRGSKACSWSRCAISCMPKIRSSKHCLSMVKAARVPSLRFAIEQHLQETKGHVDRLKEAFALVGEDAKAQPCKAKSLAEEEVAENLLTQIAREFSTPDIGEMHHVEKWPRTIPVTA